MKYRRLGKTDLRVSALSFGASSLGSVFRATRQEESLRTVHLAIDMGINYIDVSPFYGLTKAESVLGDALKTIPREKYILSTKVGRYGYEEKDFDFSAQRVTASIDESLQRLHVEHIDIIQCHDIEFGSLDQIVHETIPALRKVQEQGKIGYVGITGLPLKNFLYIADQIELDTILSYCHYSLNDSSLLEIVPALQQKDIGIINASPLSMGLLSQRGAPDWHPASEPVQARCAEAVRFCQEQGEPIEKLAVQFSVSNPDIPTTLVSTANPANIKRNIEWLEEPMDEALLQAVLDILEPIHNETWIQGQAENN